MSDFSINSWFRTGTDTADKLHAASYRKKRLDLEKSIHKAKHDLHKSQTASVINANNRIAAAADAEKVAWWTITGVAIFAGVLLYRRG